MKTTAIAPFQNHIASLGLQLALHDCIKIVRIRSFPGPYFPAFGLNTEIYSIILRIQTDCGKMQTRKTLNTDTFYAGLTNDDIDIDLANYEDGTTLYAYDLENEKVIKLLEKKYRYAF